MKKYYILFFIMLFLTHRALAEPMLNLYSASVPITSESEQARNQAVQQAFRQVLIKVSGNPSVTTSDVMVKQLNDANNYLQAYSFQTIPSGMQKNLFLTASFDEKAVNKLLMQVDQSIWGINRPLVLIWLVIQQDQSNSQITNLIASDNNNPTFQALQQQANIVGLQIMFPVLDLTDMQALSNADVLQENLTKIIQASSRYNADAILIGRVSQSPLGWQGNWLLVNNGKQSTWMSQGKTLNPVLGLGISLTAEVLSSRYKITSEKKDNLELNTITLTVNNVTNMAAYSKVLNYLHQIASVKQLEVTEVTSDKIVFNIELKSNQTTFIQTIALDHALVPMKQISPSTNDAAVYYQWVS
jgi:hypothetical protein